MILTLEQKDLLIGTLLGDAWLHTSDKGRTWAYSACQPLAQKEYLFHKYNLLQNLDLNSPSRIEQIHPTLSTPLIWYRISTNIHPSLCFYGHMFFQVAPETGSLYRGVPKNIAKFLTPRALAYWYMDVGYLKWSGNSNSVVLRTDSFHLFAVNRLRVALRQLYNLETQLSHKNLNSTPYGYRISLRGKNALLFKDLIQDQVLESMQYKLKIKESKD